jgi:hypothetical protein
MAVASTTNGERFDAGAAPNDLWCADYKGEFRPGDGRYCYPLTVTDHASPASDYRRWRRQAILTMNATIAGSASSPFSAPWTTKLCAIFHKWRVRLSKSLV